MTFFAKNQKKIVAFLVFAFLVFFLFRFLIPLFAPLIFSILIGAFLGPFVDYFQKHTKLSSSLWSGIFVLLFGICLIFFCYLIYAFLLKLGAYFLSQPEQLMDFFEKKAYGCVCQFEHGFHLKKGLILEKMQTFLQEKENLLLEKGSAFFFQKTFWLSKLGLKILSFFFFFFLGLFFFLKEQKTVDGWIQAYFPSAKQRIESFLKSYLRAQLLITLAIGSICFLGFFLAKQKDAWGWAILTACLDFLPVFGTGCILWPKMLYHAFFCEYSKTLLYLITYGLCVLTRQYLEPKLIGKSIGLSPFLMLCGFLFGIQVFGIFGFLLGPLYFLCLKACLLFLLGNS